MYKIDLHTHSTASRDGGISLSQYEALLSKGTLDCVAVTDHNKIENALALQRKLGDIVIVGEEIMSTAGEIIGLYLIERIKPGLSPLETVKTIKDQGGLVYIPHAFETLRKGLGSGVLEELIEFIDIVEVCNGRSILQNRHSQAVVWAKLNRISGAASSDAHGLQAIGNTYTQLMECPNRGNLAELLSTGVPHIQRPSMRSLLYPKYHRLRKKIGK